MPPAKKTINQPEGTYHVVKFEKTKFFEKRVSELLGLGWQLHGSPFMDRIYHCQAMTKEK